jgi:hypothetical protein
LRRYHPGGKLQQAGNTHHTYNCQGRLIEKRVHKKGFRPQIWRYQWNELVRWVAKDFDVIRPGRQFERKHPGKKKAGFHVRYKRTA